MTDIKCKEITLPKLNNGCGEGLGLKKIPYKFDSSLRVSKIMKDYIKVHCTLKGINMSKWVEQTLSNQLKKEQHGKDTK
jgi:hypothetical protein